MAGRVESGGTADTRPRRVGRPARISREAITAAAHDIGLENLTLRSVADRLGVSIAALYHHVGNKEDLLRAAAEHALAHRSPPADRGQHWARWLVEWAQYIECSLASDPGLLVHYLDGAISADTVADHEERGLDVLVGHGFTPGEAIRAFRLVTTLAVGWAVHEIRGRRSTAAATTVEGLRQVLAGRDAEDLPHLRRLAADAGAPALPTFVEQVTGVLLGLAARRGDDADVVLAHIRSG
jgi:AcrR family transcriptional regulator